MEQLHQMPDRWHQRFIIRSPVTGKSMPITEIESATLGLGGFGVGVALVPGNQRVQCLDGWECHRVSEDRRDWWIAAKVGSAGVFRTIFSLNGHRVLRNYPLHNER